MVTLNPQQLEAQATLSNPDFDVESFVKNINIHYKNTKIVESLGSHATIFLNLIESGNYQFLEIQPQFVNKNIFPEIHKMGHETWVRETPGSGQKWGRRASNWYGVVLSDELALHYRSLGHWTKCSFVFKVEKGLGAAKKMRRKWKGVKMHKIGSGEQYQAPPIYKARLAIREYVKQFNLSQYNNTDGSVSYFSWTAWDKYQHGVARNHYKFNFIVKQSGKDNVRVSCNHGNFLVKDGLRKTKYGQAIGIRIPINDKNLSLKILDWASNATTDNKRFCNIKGIFTKIDKLKADVGIK